MMSESEESRKSTLRILFQVHCLLVPHTPCSYDKQIEHCLEY